MSFWSDPIGSTLKTLSHTGKVVAKDPLLSTAALTTGAVLGGPIGAGTVQAGLNRAQGQSYGDALTGGAQTALGAYAGGQLSDAMGGASGLTGNTQFDNVVSNVQFPNNVGNFFQQRVAVPQATMLANQLRMGLRSREGK